MPWISSNERQSTQVVGSVLDETYTFSEAVLCVFFGSSFSMGFGPFWIIRLRPRLGFLLPLLLLLLLHPRRR